MRYKLIIGCIIFVCILLFITLGSYFHRQNPNEINLRAVEQRPSSIYLLGSDEVGRDVLARLIQGGKISLFIGVVASAIKLIIAISLSFSATFFEKTDLIIMRLCDVFMCFPFYVIALSMSAFLGPSINNIIIIIVFFSFAHSTRLLKTEMKLLKDMEFIQILIINKEKYHKILINHIIPNLKNTILVIFTNSVAQAILMESSLSFFGLGVQEPQASWGSMLSVALNVLNIQKKWWMYMPAGILVVLSVFSINMMGEGLKDVRDK